MVCILLGTGFEEMEALIPTDLLRRAGLSVSLVSLDGKDGNQVTGSHGITVQADLSLGQVDMEQLEMLILPGGLKGVDAIQSNRQAMAMIQTAYNRGIYLAAICAAPTILAGMGLLDRRPAVCYPGMEDQMGSAVVERNSPVVQSGYIITGEAAGSAFAFGLKLIEALRGLETAQQVKNAVHYHG